MLVLGLNYLILAIEAEVHGGCLAKRHHQWIVEKSLARGRVCVFAWYDL